MGNTAGELWSSTSLCVINNSKLRSRPRKDEIILANIISRTELDCSPEMNSFTLQWTIFTGCFEIFHKSLKRYKPSKDRQLHLWKRMSHSHWDTFHTPTGSLLTFTRQLRTAVPRLEHWLKGPEAERLLHKFGMKNTGKKQLLVSSLVVHAVPLKATASAGLPDVRTGQAEHICQGIQLRKLLTSSRTPLDKFSLRSPSQNKNTDAAVMTTHICSNHFPFLPELADHTVDSKYCSFAVSTGKKPACAPL